MNHIVPAEIHTAMKKHIADGATQYRIAEGCLLLEYPSGAEAMRLPMFAGLPGQNKAQARLLLEELAWREYLTNVGKVVWVSTLCGYDDDGSNEVHFHEPIRVRIDQATHPFDIELWNDNDYLDPVWNVTPIDHHPSMRSLRSFWIYATSRSTNGTVEPSDVIRYESFAERVQRLFAFLGFGPKRTPELAVRE